MAKIHLAILIGILLAFVLGSAPAYALARDDDPELDKEIQKILSAKRRYESQDGPGVSKGYKDLFLRIGRDGIREVKNHKNHGVALRAAWEEVRLTIPERRPEDQGPGMPVGADDLERFLGFVKGRLPVPVPRWWQRTLLSAEARRRDNVYFPSSDDDLYDAAGAGVMAKPGVKVLKQGKGLLVTIGEESLALPQSIAKEVKEHDHITVGFGSKKVYVTLHRGSPHPFPLYCVNLESGTVSWKGGVWADGGRIFYRDIPHHNVTVIASETQVTVFGGASGLLYVEAFNAEDGAVLYRFCTGY